MRESVKSASRTQWWQIGLSVLFIPCMLIWLWAYLWHAWHFIGLFASHHKALCCPIIHLPYCFTPVFGYPLWLHAITTLPFGLLWIALVALTLAGMVKITAPGLVKNGFGKLLGVLLLTGLLFLLASLELDWALCAVPYVLIIVGALYLYLRPSVKSLVVGLIFAAGFCYFVPFGVFYLNEALDKSAPVTLSGKVAGYMDFQYYIVQPDSGGNKMAISIIWGKSGPSIPELSQRYGRFDSCQPVYDFVYNRFLPQSQGGKGQPEIEVYGVHQGFFGLKWQDKGAGYRLLLGEPQPR